MPLVRAARDDKSRVEASYRCRLQLTHVPRETDVMHTFCDRSARATMRAGLDGRLRRAVPREWHGPLQAYINLRLIQRDEGHRVRTEDYLTDS